MRLPYARLLVPALFLWMALPFPASADEHGPRRDPAAMSAGGLLLRADGDLREAPLIATDVSIEVAGLIARTRVTQRFTNPTSDWVEGLYVCLLYTSDAADE